MSCKVCEDYLSSYPIWYYREMPDWHTHERSKFCPNCGEPLTQPEPLSLEQLRQMDGEPVYLIRVESDKEKHNTIKEGWYLVETDRGLVRSSQFTTITFDEMFKIFDTAAGKRHFAYNAYTRKPREDEW